MKRSFLSRIFGVGGRDFGPSSFESAEGGYSIEFPADWKIVPPNRSNTLVKARAPSGFAAITAYVAQAKLLQKYDAADGFCIASLDHRAIAADFKVRFVEQESREGSTALVRSVDIIAIDDVPALQVDSELIHEERNVHFIIRYYYVNRRGTWHVFAAACDLQSEIQFRTIQNRCVESIRFRKSGW